ncbi:hypothetical protein FISHEDRAFT_76270 [Fistulina hepatica ATCC 64428]|uniref:DDE Tnp4 domain-containing protein n=1 Tax=Fistulina hepatica ATCC 64428 TaxID=1128425 RepID=A0A0D7A3W0_9AGAR|nr:hypothetical protein FISHEDRAFT_76270 [Fistulina hepatica ATCC 64428]
MAPKSEREQVRDALEQAFFVNLIARLEACALELNDDDAGAGGAQLDDDTNVSSTDSSSSSESSSDTDSSTSSSSSDDPDDDLGPASYHLRQLAVLYANHYYNECRDIAKDHTLIHLLLEEWHNNHPDIFRSYLRITPKCFDDLIEAISDDSVFHNTSSNEQAPVVEQVTVALYRFRHYGNAASTRKVALQFGIGYGTVGLYTTHVLKATNTEQFRNSCVQWSNAHAKERAKEWVESVSCPAWRDGWCMVDGTLVPLF